MTTTKTTKTTKATAAKASTAKATAAKKTNDAPAANTTAAQANNVTPLVTKSKIDIAREHFNRISADDYQAAEGSSPRKDFIAVCMNELEMTENGASTYWQNLRNEGKGEGLYKGGRQPTGAPVGRRPDMNGRLKKAAARVQRARQKIEDNMKDLADAETDLISLTEQMTGTGEATQQAS